MKLHIVARGKIGRGPEAGLVAEYLRRIRWPVQVTELAPADPLPAPAPDSRTVALDERGTGLTSKAFADTLSRWRDAGTRETRFLIGAADGLPDEARDSADLALSFGSLTWPHLLARAMLAEQLFRATSIVAGHPYHREG